MLEIHNLKKSFKGPDGEVKALEDISLCVSSKEVVSVQGKSGSGKTTLLLVAGGLLNPNAGEVQVDGTPLYGLSLDARARFRGSRIGFVFQQFHLIPYLNVLDNVLAPGLVIDIPEAEVRAMELLEHFGLEDRIKHVPSELSVGERQRTAMARALLSRPKLILADEPTGNLDQENAEALLGCLVEYAEQGGCVLLVTHDPLSAGYAQRSLRLEKGRLE